MNFESEISIALLGFSPFEHTAIASILKLSGGRLPPHRFTDTLSAAQIILIDAENKAIVRFFMKLQSKHAAVMIGGDPRVEGFAYCPRPIVAIELIESVRAACLGLAPQHSVTAESISPQVLETLVIDRRTGDREPTTANERRPSSNADPAAAANQMLPIIAEPSFDVLLVMQGEVIAQSLMQRVRRRKLNVRVLGNGREALEVYERLGARAVIASEQVFGMSGFELCSRTKRLAKLANRSLLTAILARTDSNLSRLRAGINGIDFFVFEPLADADLDRVLAPLLRA